MGVGDTEPKRIVLVGPAGPLQKLGRKKNKDNSNSRSLLNKNNKKVPDLQGNKVQSDDNQTNCHQPVDSRVQPMSSVSFPSTSQESERNYLENNDLTDEMMAEWEEPYKNVQLIIPERLTSPSMTTEPPITTESPVPSVVANIQEMMAEWEEKYENIQSIVDWLKLPPMTPEPPVPLVVANIQEMMAEWDESYENKVQQIQEWLDSDDSDISPSS